MRHLIGNHKELKVMGWSEKGAQSMLHIRDVHIDGEMTDFHEERVKREKPHMYGALSVGSAC